MKKSYGKTQNKMVSHVLDGTKKKEKSWKEIKKEGL
jgi:hypothetical protein